MRWLTCDAVHCKVLPILRCYQVTTQALVKSTCLSNSCLPFCFHLTLPGYSALQSHLHLVRVATGCHLSPTVNLSTSAINPRSHQYWSSFISVIRTKKESNITSAPRRISHTLPLCGRYWRRVGTKEQRVFLAYHARSLTTIHYTTTWMHYTLTKLVH